MRFFKIRNRKTGLFFDKYSHKESDNGSVFKQVAAAKRNKKYIVSATKDYLASDDIEIVEFSLIETNIIS